MSNDDSLIQKSLFERIAKKKTRLDSKRPLPTDAVKRLRDEIRLLHTYHSNAIEGNTLTLQETKVILEEGTTVGGKSLKEHLEAINNAKAFDLMEELAKGKTEIRQETIPQIHETVTQGILTDGRKYRTQNVRAMGARKTPPDFSKIPSLMSALIKDMSKKGQNPVEIASFFHHRLVEIHPFIDGNGRVARLLTNLYLLKKGYPPIVLKEEDRKKYYDCLKAADAGNLKPFANFIAKAVDESLTLYLSIFGGVDELISLAELSKDSPYSQEYLSLRARQGYLDAVKINGIWHSTKRALKEYLTLSAGSPLAKAGG